MKHCTVHSTRPVNTVHIVSHEWATLHVPRGRQYAYTDCPRGTFQTRSPLRPPPGVSITGQRNGCAVGGAEVLLEMHGHTHNMLIADHMFGRNLLRMILLGCFIFVP